MATIRLPTDFKEFLKSLNDHQVEYLLVRGYAVGYHGYPRATGDMDIWVAGNSENAGKRVAVLMEFGFGSCGVTADLFLQPEQIIRMGNPPLRLEILTSISGVQFADAYAQRVADVIDGVQVDITGLSQLKLNKRASGRHKDLGDLDNLP